MMPTESLPPIQPPIQAAVQAPMNDPNLTNGYPNAHFKNAQDMGVNLTARCHSLQAQGMDHQKIVIEVLSLRGNQTLSLVGQADPALKESLEKIRCLLRQKKCWGPSTQLLVNLLPPETPKMGAHFELALYTACLLALMACEKDCREALAKMDQQILIGALGLDGQLLHTHYSERLSEERQDVVGPDHFNNLAEFENFLFESPETQLPPRKKREAFSLINDEPEIQVTGREAERFWISIASLLKAPILLLGPPGAGKSHLSKWAYNLLPKLSEQDHRICSSIWKSSDLELKNHRPLIHPHSRTRYSDFIGTSTQQRQRPGLYALAHQGLLILDEFNELNRDCRELLRTVLDEKRVLRHTRAGSIVWKADFWLILTANPCECGFSNGRDLSRCSCSHAILKNYQNRLSGPLLDRMAVKRFVDPSSDNSNSDLELRAASPLKEFHQRISQINSKDFRACSVKWQNKISQKIPQELSKYQSILRIQGASAREIELNQQIIRALMATELFSNSEIETLMIDKLQHEEKHFLAMRKR